VLGSEATRQAGALRMLADLRATGNGSRDHLDFTRLDEEVSPA
jgi:hypothetical protein